MVPEWLGMGFHIALEQVELVGNEFLHEPVSVADPFRNKPDRNHEAEGQQGTEEFTDSRKAAEAFDAIIYQGAQAHDQETGRTFGQHGQACKQTRQQEMNVPVVAGIGFQAAEVKLVDGQQHEKVEDRVDDTAAEVEMRREAPGVYEHHDPSGHGGNMPRANAVEQEECGKACQHIREARGPFVHAENLHAQGLQPDEQRRFFPEGLEVNLDELVIAGDYHFAGRFCKVDFVPVKQVHRAEKRNKEQQAAEEQQENRGVS